VKEREEKDETNDCLDLVREQSLWRNFNLYPARAAIHLKSKQATINDFPSVVSE
jgi:hypothetical protein